MKTILIAFILVTVNSFAALPPFYQTAREINVLLENKEVGDQLGVGQAIKSITRKKDTYTIASGKCRLAVHVKYLPAPMPGPAQFELEVGEAFCFP